MRNKQSVCPEALRNILLTHIKTVSRPRCEFRQVGRPRKLEVGYILDRIMYVLRTGCQWSALEVKGASYKTIWAYFDRWAQLGIFEKAFYDMTRWYKKVRSKRRSGSALQVYQDYQD